MDRRAGDLSQKSFEQHLLCHTDPARHMGQARFARSARSTHCYALQVSVAIMGIFGVRDGRHSFSGSYYASLFFATPHFLTQSCAWYAHSVHVWTLHKPYWKEVPAAAAAAARTSRSKTLASSVGGGGRGSARPPWRRHPRRRASPRRGRRRAARRPRPQARRSSAATVESTKAEACASRSRRKAWRARAFGLVVVVRPGLEEGAEVVVRAVGHVEEDVGRGAASRGPSTKSSSTRESGPRALACIAVLTESLRRLRWFACVSASTRQSAPVSSLSAVRERVGLVKFFFVVYQPVSASGARQSRAQFVRESFVSE